jgi:hypothetical protein
VKLGFSHFCIVVLLCTTGAFFGLPSTSFTYRIFTQESGFREDTWKEKTFRHIKKLLPRKTSVNEHVHAWFFLGAPDQSVNPP